MKRQSANLLADILVYACVAISLLTQVCNKSSRLINGPRPAPGLSTITGTVVMADTGEPVANAVVHLCFSDSDDFIGCSKVDYLTSTTTDSSGTYWFRNVPPGEYYPVVRISGTKQSAALEKQSGSIFPKTVKFNVRPGDALQIAPLQIQQRPENEMSPVKFVVPSTSGQTISERMPTLSWQPVDGAGGYIVQLLKLHKTTEEDPVQHIPGTFRDLEKVELSERTMFGEPVVDSNEVRPVTPLANGQYWLIVTAVKTINESDPEALTQDNLGQSSEFDGYFTIVGGN